ADARASRLAGAAGACLIAAAGRARPALGAAPRRGLYSLRYRPRSALDLDFTARTKGSTFPAVVGPARGTLVLGSTPAAGRAGACGLTASLACTGSGSTLRCR